MCNMYIIYMYITSLYEWDIPSEQLCTKSVCNFGCLTLDNLPEFFCRRDVMDRAPHYDVSCLSAYDTSGDVTGNLW